MHPSIPAAPSLPLLPGQLSAGNWLAGSGTCQLSVNCLVGPGGGALFKLGASRGPDISQPWGHPREFKGSGTPVLNHGSTNTHTKKAIKHNSKRCGISSYLIMVVLSN